MSTNRARQARPARPLPTGQQLFTPGASGPRQAIERRSATPLFWLHQLPVWFLPVAAAGLLIAGLAVRGWPGALALCGVAAALSWLAALSWPRLTGPGRLLRLAGISVVLLGAAVMALSG